MATHSGVPGGLGEGREGRVPFGVPLWGNVSALCCTHPSAPFMHLMNAVLFPEGVNVGL